MGVQPSGCPLGPEGVVFECKTHFAKSPCLARESAGDPGFTGLGESGEDGFSEDALDLCYGMTTDPLDRPLPGRRWASSASEIYPESDGGKCPFCRTKGTLTGE